MLSRTRSISCVAFQPALATPITGTVSRPRRTSWYSDGKIFLWHRSPVAPNSTSASAVAARPWRCYDLLGPTFSPCSRGGRRTPGAWPRAPCRRTRPAARLEARVQRRGEHVRRHALLDGGLDRPAALAGIGDPSGEARQRRILRQRLGRQIQQPRGDDAAAAPHFGDLRHIERVLEQARVGERRGLGVLAALVIQADVGVLEDVEAFRVGGHQAVLDAVVDHLHEVAGAVAAAVQIALRRRAVRGALGRRRAACRPGPALRKSDPGARRCSSSPPIIRQ